MHFTYFLLPALGACAALEARQEYRWCQADSFVGLLRKWNYRIRGVDTGKLCSNGNPKGGIDKCLSLAGCAPSGGGINCGGDAAGFIHGGVNVGLACDGSVVKQCIDQELGISGNTDYQCVCNNC